MISNREQVHNEVMNLVKDKKLGNDMVKYFIEQLVGKVVYKNQGITFKNMFEHECIYLDENNVDWMDTVFDQDVFNTTKIFNLSCLCRVSRKFVGGDTFITYTTTVCGKKLHFVTHEANYLDTNDAKAVMCSNIVKINGLFLINVNWDKYVMTPLVLGVYK